MSGKNNSWLDFPSTIEGLEQLTERADNEDRTAQAKLSLMHLTGKMVADDVAAAATLIEKASEDIHSLNMVYKSAAEQGIPAAQFGLYLMYANGWGVPLDQGVAIRHLRKSADAGFPRGMLALGKAFQVDFAGVEQNQDEASKWLKKAVAHGLDAG